MVHVTISLRSVLCFVCLQHSRIFYVYCNGYYLKQADNLSLGFFNFIILHYKGWRKSAGLKLNGRHQLWSMLLMLICEGKAKIYNNSISALRQLAKRLISK
jgi:hypothetical protein